MICSVFQPVRRDARGEKAYSRTWYGQFRLRRADPIVRISLQSTNKRVAEKKLREMVALRKVQMDARIRPLEDHLDNFIKDLRARGLSHEYIYIIERTVTRLIDECKWKYIGNITPQSFISWRIRNAASKAPKTLNEYLRSIRGLLRWLMRQSAIETDPLAGVSRAKTAGRERRVRRALSADEFQRLLALAGPRKLIYLVAGYTGLRRSELAALKWLDVRLDAAEPHILARASTTKNAKAVIIPLHPSAASALLEASKRPTTEDGAVFRHIPDMTTFRKDLARANIPYKDEMGRQADFHALRYTLATQLMNVGAHPRVVMEIMRHCDLRLTALTYLDATQLPTAAAINSLPAVHQLTGAE